MQEKMLYFQVLQKSTKQLNEVGIVYTVEDSSEIDYGGGNGRNSKIKDNYKRM